MIVEVYEQQQTEEEAEAENEERRELIQALGLKVKEIPAIPFPEMSESDARIWSEILPFQANVVDYTGYIPTKVLRTFKAFRDEFDKIQIWSDRAGDPILVGIKSSNKFLMARWGEALESFELLKEKAVAMWKAKRKADCERFIASIDRDALQHFSGHWVEYTIHQ